MRCMMCERLSFSHICSACQESLLTPSLHKRKILGSLPVYSFFSYNEIEPLLLTKHTDIGYYIYTILAKRALGEFAKNWEYENRVASIGIDDQASSGYSHTAVLNRALKSPNITPQYGKLRATNHHKYAGKSAEERLLNPRQFRYTPFAENEVILVDDIVTTGTTLSEASEILHTNGKKVILCLTLTDAENK
ncbi:MAG: phosphoribosyltransferase [Sulfuricurvum sp. GWF2_44_89]|uniref:Phosphoribosyltransferase n=1 Tax=Sulfuricurvum kujiense TaxID=148813 RepID=A0A2D3WKC3_9BACT|nr:MULTISPECIES: phosphoribosyltransferase family protein [Sulfuricurvum]OHD77085.1 MAG: phosphoribosyltransferase [Sulfuricurvum sp. GWF2_44_89]OHD95647.1 MAG: phosphoribosyltransferase [Sulfuricurvum sp. RIFOXYD12_FULL_44_77]OHD99517.1 MAG: phosphoribosyltransferase [Sulfuricurvum sp. RIFOXYD2_FULL_44_160]DAB37559.1 MAG TPA: phosphoribosyltransferase [Sulfuricurvum kujiense]